MKHHGNHALRGAGLLAPQEGGRFGRMFPELAPLYSNPDALRALGEGSGPMNDGGADLAANHLTLGYAFLGQFVDHDITLDTTSSLDRATDPDALQNFRTPALDLDCVYGLGREGSPHLYDGPRMLLGSAAGLAEGTDLPRAPGTGRALIGDPRNDENRIVSQLQLAFLHFHNKIVDALDDGHAGSGELFEKARETARWHYQWMLVHDFLPRVCGTHLVQRVLSGDRRTGFRPAGKRAFMPVEFSVAAYRFGHTLIPSQLATNDAATKYDIFSGDLGRGFAPAVGAHAVVDWGLFFDKPGNAKTAQKARKFDAKLAAQLMELPMPSIIEEGEQSLALRNLQRGQAMGLPSGEQVAQAMRIGALTAAELFPDSEPDLMALRSDFRFGTPLWFYLLREAAVIRQGEKLGPVGGRLVAEVMIGLLESDCTSYLHYPTWKPHLTRANDRPVGDFDMADIIHYAGVDFNAC